MASVNRVILVGNLGKDPEVRFTQSGEAVANFSLATSEQWKGKDGQKQEKTEWHRVEVFGKTAEIVRDYCTKGKSVYIEGSIRYDEWTDKDGQKKYMTKIRVSGPGSKLVLLGSKGDGERREASRPAEKAYQPPADDFQATDDDVPFAHVIPALLTAGAVIAALAGAA
jgi:single-strand DNA-binding protein